MKNIVQKTINVIKENLSLNVFVIFLALYFVCLSIAGGMAVNALLVLAVCVLYFLGAFLGKIRRYIPIVISVLAIFVFSVAGIFTIMGKPVGMGFVAFGVPIIFYSIAAYDSTNNAMCIPHCLAMLGAECVFCLNGDTRGMVVLVGALLLSVMFTNATYTAMSKYVFSLFLALAVIKLTGIWHIVNETQATELVKSFIDSWVLYIALVVLGLVSLLLKERHPRIKSDRDKKYVPVLKQWQIIIGFSMIVLVFWGILYLEELFEMYKSTSGITQDMLMNLIFVGTMRLLGDSVMMSVIRVYGFIPLMFFTMMMIAFIYKAYANYKSSHLFADKLLMLMMAGLFVYVAFLGVSVPTILLGGLLAGCVVNGSYAIEQK